MANRIGGIDLGGTKIQAILTDSRYRVIGQSRRPTPTTGGPADIAIEMAAAMRAAEAQASGRGTLVGAGVGSPGVVDADNGTVAEARNLPGWAGTTFPLADVLSNELGAPIHLGNDVQVATDAEAALGAARKVSSLLGVFWGTGVGGGLRLAGQPWEGREAAGEIGHMVIRQGGRLCPCGRRGCMEAYAGRLAMETRARKLAARGHETKLFQIMERRGAARLTSGIWARALNKQDKLAMELMDDAVSALGAGIASAVNLLDPEMVVIGGGLGVRLGEPYVERIREAMLPHLFRDDDPPPVELAALGDLGGALGAALLVPVPPPAPRRRTTRA